MRLAQPISLFGAANVLNGVARPTNQPNAWVAAVDEERPVLTLRWETPQTIARVELGFDTDFDHPMETVLWGHPENRMPFCVRGCRLLDGEGTVLAECDEQHQTRRTIVLSKPAITRELRIELWRPSANVPAALFDVRFYGRGK